MLSYNKGSGETGRMPRLIWAFAGHLCDKYPFHMGQLTMQINRYYWDTSQENLSSGFATR